jgi:hypothetical protein
MNNILGLTKEILIKMSVYIYKIFLYLFFFENETKEKKEYLFN